MIDPGNPRIEIIAARPEHIGPLAGKLRGQMLESIALTGKTPAAIMEICYRASTMRHTALLDGEVAAMWGCAGVMLGGVGEAWLFVSRDVVRVPRSVLRIGAAELAQFRGVFREIRGLIFRADQPACRFAERLGCILQKETDAPFAQYEVA